MKFTIPLAYLALILIWGSTWIAIKVSVGNVPFTMAALRFFAASGALAVYQLLRHRSLLPAAGHRKVILALGIGNFSIGYGLTYWGMQYVPSNVTSILWATMPVQVSIIAHFMLHDEKLGVRSIISLLGALLGSLLLFDIHAEDLDLQTTGGMLVILLSILGASWSNVLFKRQGSHLDPVAVNISSMLIGAGLLLVAGLFLEPWQMIKPDALRMGATAYLALFGSALGFSLYFWLFRHVSVVKMSYTTFLIPILASFWGWVILGETLTPLSMLGAVMILLSVSLPESQLFRRRIP